ncbi:poly-gamma-glutamate hydrolase family protein [Micromonospora sp. NPDC050686]|uniref:poly-gamma-glutamate hydrolase family protein n=1 Tax=Micromonospora sp. NPDC050686 TaxID=3154631 RepID=UPI0033E2D953
MPARRRTARVNITLAGGGAADIDGTDPRNICNRTVSRAGGQLELTTALRSAMFGTNTRAERKNTTLPLFWDFVRATRTAIARRAG